jgi:hypothetical protein
LQKQNSQRTQAQETFPDLHEMGCSSMNAMYTFCYICLSKIEKVLRSREEKKKGRATYHIDASVFFNHSLTWSGYPIMISQRMEGI